MAITPVPEYPQIMKWFLFDLSNKILITSTIIPETISDNKNIILAEHQIPGLDYSPVHSGGMGNRKVAFTLKLINRDKIYGNVHKLKMFDNLRQRSFDLIRIFQKTSQFTANPKVIYKWGTGSIPLVYYVSKCDFQHNGLMVNAMGEPMVTDVSIELILDGESPVNRGEEVFRQLASINGQNEQIFDEVFSRSQLRRPY